MCSIGVQHKVLTYVEYRAVPSSTPLSTQRVCPPSAPKAGGTHSPGGEGGGGSIFWKTPAIGLASNSLISLRCAGYPVPAEGLHPAWQDQQSVMCSVLYRVSSASRRGTSCGARSTVCNVFCTVQGIQCQQKGYILRGKINSL
jgi:hypothetical protein